jgi:hypothetical protein
MSDPGPSPHSIAVGPGTIPDTAQLQNILNSPVPRLYANGFVVAQTHSDFSVVFLTNAAPSAVLSMSFISAKSLIEEMAKAMSFLEAGLEQKIPTINEVATKMTAAQSKNK